MQLTTGLILLTATASIASAWIFTGYTDFNYGGDVVINATSGANPCLNVTAIFNDQLSSFKWDRTCNEFCEFTLFTDYKCAGPVLVTSRDYSLHSDMSEETNDLASSLSVHCY